MLFAWNGTGHMLVAEVAYQQLDPSTAEQVDRLIKKVHPLYDRVDSFTTAGPWADDIKGHSIKFLDSWHYIDTPFSDDGSPLDQISDNPQHVVWIISKTTSLLRSKNANDAERAVALMFLIHTVGDVHQPLHNSTRVTAAYPEGDRGGNSFRLRGRFRNLHSLWDSALGQMRYLRRPLSQTDKTWLESYAEKITHSYPLTDAELASSAVEWSAEGFQISKNGLYQGIKPQQEVPSAYFAKYQPVAEQQLAHAGQRLANVLNCVYQSASCVKA